MDTQDERVDLLTSGIQVRGLHVNLTNNSPLRKDHSGDVRITVRDVPLSADDSIIVRALTLRGCELTDNIQRERLRIDNRATNCENGTRIVWVKQLREDLPRQMEMGIYQARVFYRDQPSSSRARPEVTCAKCGEVGHHKSACPKTWKCHTCGAFGHKKIDCVWPWPQDDEDEGRPWEQETEEPTQGFEQIKAAVVKIQTALKTRILGARTSL